MDAEPLGSFLRSLRQSLGSRGGSPMTDAQLVERFAAHGDEAAFEVFLWRHGPMVWAVCRRLLRQPQDIEDAFQATFLTLVRKARSVSKREAVAGWT